MDFLPKVNNNAEVNIFMTKCYLHKLIFSDLRATLLLTYKNGILNYFAFQQFVSILIFILYFLTQNHHVIIHYIY